MYCIRVENNNPIKSIIYLEGWLYTVSTIEKELSDILTNLKNNKEISIDLCRIEAISDDVLKMLKQFQKCYPISFLNYSLFIEMRLAEYNLLEPTELDDDKL